MSPFGIIIVHDTGLHVNDIVKGTCSCEFPNKCGVLHCPPERQFINWIGENYPEWQIINVHTFVQYRHGLTLIQRKHKLTLEPAHASKCTYSDKRDSYS